MERWVSNRRGSSPCRSTWQTGRQISNCRGLEGGVWPSKGRSREVELAVCPHKH